MNINLISFVSLSRVLNRAWQALIFSKLYFLLFKLLYCFTLLNEQTWKLSKFGDWDKKQLLLFLPPPRFRVTPPFPILYPHLFIFHPLQILLMYEGLHTNANISFLKIHPPLRLTLASCIHLHFSLTPPLPPTNFCTLANPFDILKCFLQILLLFSCWFFWIV